jgi:hypothetical protein
VSWSPTIIGPRAGLRISGVKGGSANRTEFFFSSFLLVGGDPSDFGNFTATEAVEGSYDVVITNIVGIRRPASSARFSR